MSPRRAVRRTPPRTTSAKRSESRDNAAPRSPPHARLGTELRMAEDEGAVAELLEQGGKRTKRPADAAQGEPIRSRARARRAAARRNSRSRRCSGTECRRRREQRRGHAVEAHARARAPADREKNRKLVAERRRRRGRASEHVPTAWAATDRSASDARARTSAAAVTQLVARPTGSRCGPDSPALTSDSEVGGPAPKCRPSRRAD